METVYTKEEQEILDYVENQNPKSITGIDSEKARYKAIFESNFKKRKPVNIRLLEADLAEIKREALRDGIPYQTLIGSIIHRYTKGHFNQRK